MPKIKLIDITQLQPIQSEIDEEHLLELYQKQTHKPIEVVKFQGKIYISDGHHELFTQHQKGITKIATNYDDFDNAKPAYLKRNKEFLDNIIKKAQEMKDKGITHISHLDIV